MISPLIRLFIREPELLADHLGAYLELARTDLCRFRHQVRCQMALLWIISAGVLTCAVLAGVAALLWAARHEAYWVFFAVPLVPFMLTLVCAMALSRHAQTDDPLERILSQVEADLKVLGRNDDANAAEREPHTASDFNG